MNDDQYFNDKMEEIHSEQKDMISFGVKLLKRLDACTNDDIKLLITSLVFMQDQNMQIFEMIIKRLKILEQELNK